MEMELRLISPFPSTTSTHKIHKQINEQKYNQIKIKKFHGKKNFDGFYSEKIQTQDLLDF
jgi:hypothetical protein